MRPGCSDAVLGGQLHRPAECLNPAAAVTKDGAGLGNYGNRARAVRVTAAVVRCADDLGVDFDVARCSSERDVATGAGIDLCFDIERARGLNRDIACGRADANDAAYSAAVDGQSVGGVVEVDITRHRAACGKVVHSDPQRHPWPNVVGCIECKVDHGDGVRGVCRLDVRSGIDEQRRCSRRSDITSQRHVAGVTVSDTDAARSYLIKLSTFDAELTCLSAAKTDTFARCCSKESDRTCAGIDGLLGSNANRQVVGLEANIAVAGTDGIDAEAATNGQNRVCPGQNDTDVAAAGGDAEMAVHVADGEGVCVCKGEVGAAGQRGSERIHVVRG